MYKGGVILPTNKDNFRFHIDEILLMKIKHIAKAETRSTSNLLEHLCKLCVKDYEAANGEISVEYE